MTRSERERSMPLVFEIHDGRTSRFLSYERVLSDRECGRRVVEQALNEFDAWRKTFGRLFEVLQFAAWRKLIALLDQVRGPRPQRSPAHTRARKDSQYARDKFYEAIAAIDEWRRRYESLFEHLKHAAGRKITRAIDKICHPDDGQVFYVWDR